MIGAIVVGQDRGVRSMEKTEEAIEEIEKLAEIALEHEKCKTFETASSRLLWRASSSNVK
jgi:hypothetical protein